MRRNPKIVSVDPLLQAAAGLMPNPAPSVTEFEEEGDYYVIGFYDRGVPVRFRMRKDRPQGPEGHLQTTPYGDTRGTYYRWHKSLHLQDIADRWHKYGAKVRDDSHSSFELPSGEFFQAFYPVYELWRHREDDRPYHESLAETMEEKGWLSPIQVSFGRQDGNILIGEGNHRLRVAYEKGLRHVPVRFFFQQHVEKPTAFSRLRRKQSYEATQMGESRKSARKHDLAAYEKRGLKFNPSPAHHRLRRLVPNITGLSPRDKDELLRRVRELDALEERALRAYERGDFHLAERIDAEYAERADELEGLAAELSEDLADEDAEPGEWKLHPMTGKPVPGPEGATDLTADLARLYDEYLNDRSPHSRFESPELFTGSPFPMITRGDVLAYLAMRTIEEASGRPLDTVNKEMLVDAARDAHERRRQLLTRTKMTPNPSPDIDEVFDEAFDRVEDVFPDVGTIEFWEDEAAGADNGAGADRQFAYCKDGNPIAIAFAPKAVTLGREQLVGLMRHEFGHALEYRFGVAELERRLKVRLPDTVERRADAIAEAVWREPIVYDERLIQCVVKNPGVRPRPAHLPDERSVLKPNKSPRVLYHGTSSRRIGSMSHTTNPIYLAEDEETAESYAERAVEFDEDETGEPWEPVVLTFDVATLLEDGQLQPDHDDAWSAYKLGEYLEPPDTWSWQMSLERLGTVSYTGPLRRAIVRQLTGRPSHLPQQNPARMDGDVKVYERDDQFVVFDWIPDDAPPGYEGVVEFEDGIGAYMTAELVESEEEPHKRLMVDYIEVDTPYRRSGVATRLYQEALAYARRHGATLVSDSRRTLGADMFWQKMARLGVAELRGEQPVKRWDGEILDYRVTYYVMKPDAPELLP